VPVELQRSVRAQFANACAYCRTVEVLTVVTFEIEHIIPFAMGGRTAVENLCLACPSCNRFKADRTSARDPISEREVPLFHPQRDAWGDHFGWRAGAIEIEGITAVGRATVVALRMNRPQLVRVRRMWVIMGEHPPGTDAGGTE
jgi:hypothetical protein